MVNIWNPYQCMVTFNLSRSASLFESGIGRGMGFRDSNQDLLGFVHMVPERARERILDIAATQLPTGGAYHQYQPLTKRGNDAIGSGFNDDPLWLILGVAAYIKETGDCGDPRRAGAVRQRAGLGVAALRAPAALARYTLDRLGPHGLPLIGRADWNDCLNLNCFSETPGESFQTTENRAGGVAESVFIAGLFVLAADELAALAERHGRHDDAAIALPAAARDDGCGGRASTAGTASGSAAPTTSSATRSARPRTRRARSSSSRRACACSPASASTTARPTRRSTRSPTGCDAARHRARSSRPTPATTSSSARSPRTRPGYKENAGIFCHNNPWIMIAETRGRATATGRSTTTCGSTRRPARSSARSTAASRTSTRR